FFFFFFNDTATTEIYTLSLHDALPISRTGEAENVRRGPRPRSAPIARLCTGRRWARSRGRLASPMTLALGCRAEGLCEHRRRAILAAHESLLRDLARRRREPGAAPGSCHADGSASGSTGPGRRSRRT